MNDEISKIRQESAKIRIGKNGITENIVVEVENILKKNNLIKVKCLKVIPNENTRLIAENIAKLTKSKIVEIRGKTFILEK